MQFDLTWVVDTFYTNTPRLKAQCKCKVLSVAKKTLVMKNQKKSEYFPCTIDLINDKGEIKKAIKAIIFKANREDIKVGEEYFATISFTPSETPDRRYFTKVSPIMDSRTLTDADFTAIQDAVALLQTDSPA